MPTLAGIKHLSIHFFPPRTHNSRLLTEHAQRHFNRNGHQSAYSLTPAPTLYFTNISDWEKGLFMTKTKKIQQN